MIKLAFTGDIMLSRGVEEAIDKNDKSWNLITEGVRAKLETYDFVIGNLECPIAVSAAKKANNKFKANPLTLNHIKLFNLLTTANNHIFDCGKVGATETLKFLKKNSFHTCGLKESEHDNSFFVTRIKDKNIGFIAAAVDECIHDNSDSLPHVLRAESPSFLKEVNDLSKRVDFLFLLIHGGNEMISYPEPSFRSLCKRIINAGASCVITHHPHVLGGHEMYQGKPIIYSLGDFIFDGKSYKRRRGAILEVNIIENNLEFNLVPTKINDSLNVEIADDKTFKPILKRWKIVSKRMAANNYEKNYKVLYLYELLVFQADRLKFMMKYDGIGATLKFMYQKLYLVGFYVQRILKGKMT